MCRQVLKNEPKANTERNTAQWDGDKSLSLLFMPMTTPWYRKVSVDSKGIKSSSRQAGGQATDRPTANSRQNKGERPSNTAENKRKKGKGEKGADALFCVISIQRCHSYPLRSLDLFFVASPQKDMYATTVLLSRSLSLLRRLFYVLCSSFSSFHMWIDTLRERQTKKRTNKDAEQTGKDKKNLPQQGLDSLVWKFPQLRKLLIRLWGGLGTTGHKGSRGCCSHTCDHCWKICSREKCGKRERTKESDERLFWDVQSNRQPEAMRE